MDADKYGDESLGEDSQLVPEKPRGSKPPHPRPPLGQVQGGPPIAALEDLGLVLRERKRQERQRIEKKRAALTKLIIIINARVKETELQKNENAMSVQAKKDEEAQRHVAEYEAREAERLARLAKLKGVDFEVIGGKKRIDERNKAKAEEDAKRALDERKQALDQQHARSVMGPEFYQHIKQHEEDVLRVKKNRELEGRSQDVSVIPSASSKAMERYRQEQAEASKLAKEKRTEGKAKREKQDAYAKEVPPPKLVSKPTLPIAHDEHHALKTLDPHELFVAGNDNMKQAAAHISKANPHVPYYEEEAAEGDVKQKLKMIGNAYMKQGAQHAAPRIAPLVGDATYTAETTRLRKNIKAQERHIHDREDPSGSIC